ncbi:MAG: 4Fe-4S binding protein [Bacillota bacterium]|nr:4Fe-4S binding protein [Bacillota bacterium]
MKRKIVHIDEDKCNGCGICVPACHEGAIQIMEGKARLLSDNLCDGLGDCLGECPEGAITILEREADSYDEEAVQNHVSRLEKEKGSVTPCSDNAGGSLPCGCPSSQIKTINRMKEIDGEKVGECPSLLQQWPVQLALLPPKAGFFQGANLLVAADCVPFAYGNFHQRFLKDNTLVVGCPKLDDAGMYVEKLAEIIKYNDIKKITVAYMEVPCCSAFIRIIETAMNEAGKEIPLEKIVVSTEGEIL